MFLCIYGNFIAQISKYVEDMNDTSGYPKLIIGEAGAGKSSIMAKAAKTALLQMDRSSQHWLATAVTCSVVDIRLSDFNRNHI